MSTGGLIAMLVSLAAVTPARASPQSPADLAMAQQAYEEGRYEEVLPAIELARRYALTESQRVRAYELEAFTQAAFEDGDSAVEAFRLLLGLAPAYALSTEVSPKLQRLLARARQLGAIAPPPGEPLPSAALPSSSPPRPSARAGHAPGVLTSWWLWAGVGVVVSGGAGLLFLEAQRRASTPPPGNLGRGELR